MKRIALIMAVVGIATGAAWATPTYQYSFVDVGGGLCGVTFTCDNTGEPASAWFAEMQWRGATQAEVDQHCQWWPGAIPGAIIQSQAFGAIGVHCEVEANIYDPLDPNYYKSRDTWIKAEFCHACQALGEGPNSFYAECGTAAGMQYVTVPHAYVVADGSFAYEGRLGVMVGGAPVWTSVSGYICIPEPGAMALLIVGALALIRRRRGQALA